MLMSRYRILVAVAAALAINGVAVVDARDDCPSDGTASTYGESVSSTTRTISASGCPNYVEIAHNPNEGGVINYNVRVPSQPMLAGSDTPLGEKGGATGILFDGGAVYSCYGGPTYGACSDWSSSAVQHEGDTFNNCAGHADQGQNYHYHVPPVCLMAHIGAYTDGSSPQVGWSYDGFPIYGNTHPNGGLWQQCGTSGADSTYCTDSCGGYASSSYPHDNFVYRYVISGESGDRTTSPVSPLATSTYFPHTPLCLKGCCPSGVACTYSTLPACGSSATAGTNSAYSPLSASPWSTGTATVSVPTWTEGTTPVGSVITTTTAVDCAGTFSEYGACSVTCGGGTQTRTFTETTAASGGGAACTTTPLSQSCNTAPCATTQTFVVTASSTTDYTIDGTADPSLTLTAGSTYEFSLDVVGHPFWIKSVQGPGQSNAYSTGVTNNGASSGTLTFTVPTDAPATLFYNCEFHSGMTGTITVTGSSATTTDTQPEVVATTSATGGLTASTWTSYALIRTKFTTTADYTNGYTTIFSDEFVNKCSDYVVTPHSNLVVRVTMGTYVDYFKLTGPLCQIFKETGVWYWHSSVGRTGPWKAVPGNHGALLLGFTPYESGDTRTWGPFVGAPLTGGYYEEGGGCCHNAVGSPIQFWRMFEIHLSLTN